MKKLIDLKLENLSTKDTFLFRICCGVCGRDYAVKPQRFSKAGVVAQTSQKQILYDAIYEQEFRDARQTAVRRAAEHFNLCPICRQIVCNSCFLICEDLDICAACAERLNETGTPVVSDPAERCVPAAGF